jgi:acetyltransferase-like isoleucine patch superfamily enzyme
VAGNAFDIKKVIVGNETYGKLFVRHFGNDSEFLKIGSYCSIGPNCLFILGGEHEYKTLTTFPIKKFFLNKDESKTKGSIILEDDVWLGYGVTILSGITIGKGAIVGAKSVVVKDIPPYSIVGGNPAKVLKYRFDNETITELLKFNIEKLRKQTIYKDMNLFYENISSSNVDCILKRIDKDNDNF